MVVPALEGGPRLGSSPCLPCEGPTPASSGRGQPGVAVGCHKDVVLCVTSLICN